MDNSTSKIQLPNNAQVFALFGCVEDEDAAIYRVSSSGEVTYETVSGLDFKICSDTVSDLTGKQFRYGTALDLLRLGAKVQRAGWNGKGMWLAYMFGMKLPAYNWQGPGSKVNDRTARLIGKDTDLVTDPYIAMWTTAETWQPGWLPSQADQFAADWQLAPEQPEGLQFFATLLV